ncbi:UNVERIFIED_CONTAM: hypothetical protein Scaly_2003100 [Sesamum calycinum]|uniref:Serine aminopeptidase S33 domain-containing protein n=1 Tax=Sesamum calycinum TaxID=2727403 RepID=A0AAW2N1G0_9LAMI
MQQKITIQNKRGEKLVGILHETGSANLVVLCHGFRSSKDDNIMVNLAAALETEGISVFRFDFSGNGESEGSFQFGNYISETEDLRSVVEYFRGINRLTVAVLGHSKGEGGYQVTEESMMERLNTNMHEACLSIDKRCRVLTVHGTADEVIPVEDAREFAKIIPNHKLQIVEGANHGYSSHQDELASAILPFVKACMQHCEDVSI